MSSKRKVRVFVSETHDPWFNLATEDWIFKELDPEAHVLFLWRNSDTVVIGRFQNPWVECNTSKMYEDGVKLARRQSGGGAVFQDLGNTNFTFLSSKHGFDKAANNKIITSAINHFDLNSYPSGRNDILVDDSEGPKKISGSAFKEKRDRSFHHGTLLINADLQKLANYLSPHQKKMAAKGITSVRSRVTNLSHLNPEIAHESLTNEVINQFFDFYQNDCPVETLEHSSLESIPELQQYYQFLKDDKWRFGETPQFSHHLDERFDWGGVDVHLDVHKGVIRDCVIFSDSLHPELIQELMEHFKAASYSVSGIDKVVSAAQSELPFLKNELSQFREWLKKEIL